jgi:beta-glucuronidase
MRLFEPHKLRQVKCLDGLWHFATSADFMQATSVAVPGCWDTTFAHARHRGKAWYKREVEVREPGAYRLLFDGVANSAMVWVDDTPVADHYGPHTKFRSDVFELEPGMHELVVAADNSFGDHNTLLEEKCGWYCFGGIHRSVHLERLAQVVIESVHVKTLAISATEAQIEVEIGLRNVTKHSQNETVEIAVTGMQPKTVCVTLKPAETRVETCVTTVKNPRLWSPESPALYTLAVSTDSDDVIERFGIRTIKTGKGTLLLNGRELSIRGINHHDYQPLTGHTQTLAQIKYDLDAIKDLGCNLIRTSHYPKDDLFLDLCDEMGLMVWAEATGWQNTPAMITRPLYEQQCSQCLREMVGEQFNHPSIIIWGLLNEVRSEFAEIRPVMTRLIALIKTLDPLRPVTFATNRLLHNKDKMLDLVDIISPNLYTGWFHGFYGKEADGLDDAGYFDKLLEWFDGEGLSDKPILIGEFGAGAISGFHSFSHDRWSEEKQAEILDRALEVYLNHPRCTGAIVWLFADTLCSESEEFQRPYSHNCKGIVDAYRKPKLGYHVVKKHFTHKGEK